MTLESKFNPLFNKKKSSSFDITEDNLSICREQTKKNKINTVQFKV